MKTNLNFLLITLLLTLFLAACEARSWNDEPSIDQTPIKQSSVSIARKHFANKEELLDAIANDRSRLSRKSQTTDSLGHERQDSSFLSIADPIEMIARSEDWANIKDDEIVQLEIVSTLAHIDSVRLIENSNIGFYEAAGYDSIVPDIEFAKLLNIKGEIEVGDTIYKISPRGTYFFRSDLEPYFASRFESFENLEGAPLGDGVYMLDRSGIFRYDTFEKALPPEVVEGVNPADTIIQQSSNSNVSLTPYVPFFTQIDWSKFPIYVTDAKTQGGVFIQKLIGRNKSFHYTISKNRRVQAKLYYFNYLVYASTGVKVEIQKKNWIGWSNTQSDKLTAHWQNIAFCSSYSIKPPISAFSGNDVYVSDVELKNFPGFVPKVKTVQILGYDFSKDDLKKIGTYSAKKAFNLLNSRLGKKVDSGDPRAVMIYGPDKVYGFYFDGYEDKTNSKWINYKFANNVHFYLTFNLFKLPLSWLSWAKSVQDTQLNYPKLIGGTVQVGAQLNGVWGGMTLVKKQDY